MLKSCPRFLKCKAEQSKWEMSLLKSWKLFCLVLMMICANQRASVLWVETNWPSGSTISRVGVGIAFIQIVRHRMHCTEEEEIIRHWQAAQSRVELVHQWPPRTVTEFQPECLTGRYSTIVFAVHRLVWHGAQEAGSASMIKKPCLCCSKLQRISPGGQVPQVVCRSLMLQFASSTRAGTDCVELNPNMIVLSIDGVGDYDHVYRASMLAKLVEVPGLRDLLPFVKTAYSSASSYVWSEEEECGTRSNSMRVENKTTPPPCHCCSAWAYRTPSRMWGNPGKRVSVCSRSLTAVTFCHHPRERL